MDERFGTSNSQAYQIKMKERASKTW